MGSLAFILHAHLPFVRHPEHDDFLEERWLFEAITETYIPLLSMMQRLQREGIRFKLAMSVTPTLCAMLGDQLLCKRYVRHLESLIEFCKDEIGRHRKHPQLRKLSRFYFDLFSESRRWFVEECGCDLLKIFAALRKDGALELIGCAATHGLLPLLCEQAPETARAQLLIGRDVFKETFGEEPFGWWLPECAYSAKLNPLLQEANVRWFVLDAHGIMSCRTRVRGAQSIRHIIHRRDQRLLPAIPNQAGRFGALMKDILAITPTGSSIVMPPSSTTRNPVKTKSPLPA